jgi:hypothetical protein
VLGGLHHDYWLEEVAARGQMGFCGRQHQIGETAQQFFRIAQMADRNGFTALYGTPQEMPTRQSD